MFRMKQRQQKSRTLMPLPGVFEGLSRQRLRDAFKRRRSAVQLCSPSAVSSTRRCSLARAEGEEELKGSMRVSFGSGPWWPPCSLPEVEGCPWRSCPVPWHRRSPARQDGGPAASHDHIDADDGAGLDLASLDQKDHEWP